MHRCGHLWAHGHFMSYGHDWWPGTLLPTLSTLLWIALFLGLAWSLIRWISPYILPMIADIFGMGRAEPSALEILRRRYAAGEINAVTFEQMRERLEASYSRHSHGIPHDDNDYAPTSHEQERYPPETEG
jgi:uncharacterized membrane protein